MLVPRHFCEFVDVVVETSDDDGHVKAGFNCVITLWQILMERNVWDQHLEAVFRFKLSKEVGQVGDLGISSWRRGRVHKLTIRSEQLNSIQLIPYIHDSAYLRFFGVLFV